jgi:cysteinyl-tRNA synthetase
VSEYIPENISFIQKIIEKGFAYKSNGSVYFNVAKFDAAKDHHYAKLVPEAFGDQVGFSEQKFL